MTFEEICLEQQNIIEKLIKMNGALLLEVAQHRAITKEEAKVLSASISSEGTEGGAQL